MMHKVNTQGWPLVPCDPAAIPEGYEPVRVGFPRAGEMFVWVYGSTECWNGSVNSLEPPRLIIRPIPKPIRLPTSIVPHGWWVAKDEDNQAWVYEAKPSIDAFAWIQEGVAGYKLPPWIAAQLPREWHDLPWDQSAVQQQEGGDA